MLTLAYATFLVNFLFGLGVAGGVIPRGRYRRVHHAIYALVMLTIVAALALSLFRKDGFWPRLAAMTTILAAMPRFPGRESGHRYYATFSLVVYSLILFTS